MRYILSKKELKRRAGIEFNEGDIVNVGKYDIHIVYGPYSRPSLKSWVENLHNCSILDCTPGVHNGWPYFISDFLGRKPAQNNKAEYTEYLEEMNKTAKELLG